MFARFSFLVIALGALLMAPRAAVSQQPSNASRTAGPRIELTATATQSLRARAGTNADTSDTTSMRAAQRQGMGKPVALMVVGGAAVVLGAVIGDAPGTLFMIGGAVAFLYGLYRYMQ